MATRRKNMKASVSIAPRRCLGRRRPGRPPPEPGGSPEPWWTRGKNRAPCGWSRWKRRRGAGSRIARTSHASPMRLLSTSNRKVMVMFGQLSRLSSMPSLYIAKALEDHKKNRLAIKELRKWFIKRAFYYIYKVAIEDESLYLCFYFYLLFIFCNRSISWSKCKH